jgi:hypothetical protein
MQSRNARQHKAAWILLGLGLFYIPLLALHFAFPLLFDWNTQTMALSRDNAGLLWCLHACAIFWLASMGIATCVEGWQLLRNQKTSFGRGLWLWMAAFYLFRLLAEIPCFGWAWDTPYMLAILSAIACLYAAAWALLAPARALPTHHRNDAIALLLH